ncbi:MAG: hypothetical protein WD358_07410 [Nitriliruptoraceae bacterium]
MADGNDVDVGAPVSVAADIHRRFQDVTGRRYMDERPDFSAEILAFRRTFALSFDMNGLSRRLPIPDETRNQPRLRFLGENTMADSVVVQSKVKDAIKAQGLRMDSNLPDALNEKVHALVAKAAKRAKENGRGTLRPYDL